MSILDDYGLPADGDDRRRGEDPAVWRARLRDQGRENRRLRAELAARDAAGQRSPADEARGRDDLAEQQQPDVAGQQAELLELNQARAAAEALLEAERVAFREAAGLPAGAEIPAATTPEAIRASALVNAAAAGASPPTEGLEGMLTRLQDKSVSWPQLQQEMQAMGFKDQPNA
jgi:hypothetical protein